MSTPTLERTFRGHRNAASAGSFHPSLQQIASGSHDGNVMVWSSKPTMRAFRFVGHRGPVTDVTFNAQGSLIASASADATVRIWVPSVRGESSVIKAHAGTVRSARFSQDGQSLVTCSDDKSVKLWNVLTQRFAGSYVGHQNWVSCCSLSNDGRLGASGGDDKTVQVWDAVSRKNIHTFYEHMDSVTCVAFHPDGHCVAAGSADRTINLWDLRMNQLLQHYDAHSDAVTSIDFDATGSWLLSGSRDASAKLWDLKEGFHYCTVGAHEGPVLGARFSPCGTQFVTTGQDALVMVWNSNLPGVAPQRPRTARQAVESSIVAKSLRSPSASGGTTARMRPSTAPDARRAHSSSRGIQRPALTNSNVNSSSRIGGKTLQKEHNPNHDAPVTIETTAPIEGIIRQVDCVSQTQTLLEKRMEDNTTNVKATLATAQQKQGATDDAIASLTTQLRVMEERNRSQEHEIQKLHEALLVQQQIVQDLYSRITSGGGEAPESETA